MTINQSLSSGQTYSLSGAWSDLGEKKITTTVNLTFNGGEVHTESVSASGLVKVLKAQVSPTNQYLYVCPGDTTNLVLRRFLWVLITGYRQLASYEIEHGYLMD